VDGREVKLVVTPSAASVLYTTDAASPRASGNEYAGPFSVPADQDVLVRVLARDGDIEKEEQKRFDRRSADSTGSGRVNGPEPNGRVPTVREHVDEHRPAMLVSNALSWTATKGTYDALDALQAAKASAVGRRLTVGEGDRTITVALGSDATISGEHLKGLITAARSALAAEEAAATMILKSVRFPTGADLIAFLNATRIEVGDPREAIRQGEGV